MAFSADAIGFYLQAEDQLTPVLAGAASSYERYTGEIERQNRRLYDSATAGLGQIGKLVDAIDAVPGKAKKSYEEAMKAVAKAVKPITQPLTLKMGPAETRKIGDAIGRSVSKALAGAALRLSATFPQRKLGYFDQSVGLRSLYSTVPQPPDMKGKLEPRRFKTGGIVDGPGKGFDSVLSLLEPGEIVVPKDVSAMLIEMAGQSSGQFLSGTELPQALSDIDNLSKGLVKLKGALEAGLGNPRDVQTYQAGVRELERQIAALDQQTNDLSYSTRVRLAPAIKDSKSQLEQFTESGERSGSVFEHFFGKILGPTRFLAVSEGIKQSQEALSDLSQAGTGAFDTLGGDQAESFYENMNQLPRLLDLSRTELRGLKNDATAVARQYELSLNGLGESLEGLAEAGVRSTDQLLRLAPVTQRFASGTTADVNDAAAAAYQLEDAYGLAAGQIAVVFDNIRRTAENANIDAAALLQDMQDNIAQLGPALVDMTESDRVQVLSSFNLLSGALVSNWAGATDQITGLLGRALSGDVEAIGQAELVFGQSIGGIEDRLRSGNLEGLFDQLGERVQSLAGNEPALEALRNAIGFEGTAADLAQVGQNIDGINASLRDLGDRQLTIDQTAEAMEGLKENASANKTFFESFAGAVQRTASKELPLLGVSALEIVDGFKEVNLTGLLGLGVLAKMGVEAALTGGKFLGLGKTLTKVGGGLSALRGAKAATTAVSAAGGAAGAVGGAGLFTGLAGGLTALAGGIGTLGAVLLSPPGIAFTVSLAAGVLAVGTSLRIANPAIKTFGNVAIAGFGAAVDALGEFVPLAQTVVETAGGVFLGIIRESSATIGMLTEADPGNLALLGPGLVSTAGGVVAVAGGITALGLAVTGSNLASFLSGGLEKRGIAGVVEGLIGDYSALADGETRIEDATRAISNSIVFVNEYGRLLTAIGNLPGGGLLGGLFGTDYEEKLRRSSQDVALVLRDMQAQFRRADGLTQSTSVPSLNPQQIQLVVDAVRASEAESTMHDDMMTNNQLLARMVALLEQQNRGGAAPDPQTVQSGPRRQPSRMTGDIAGFDL